MSVSSRAPTPRHALALSLAGGLAAAVAATALAVVLWGAGQNLHLRPLDGVEGDLLFEASRVRAGLPLYVDPTVGALDYGPIAARYYVLYPPLWAGALSLFPAAWAATGGRGLSCLAWWGLLGFLAWTAPRPHRKAALLAAAFVGGVQSLAEFGGAARPDAAALAVAGYALVRVLRRGEVDAVAGALFALAAWTKPNVVGMGAGALVAAAIVAPRRSLHGLAGALGLSLLIAGFLEVASAGSFPSHLLAGAVQPLRARLLVHHLAARAQFFALFLGLAAGFAAARVRSDGRGNRPALFALCALAGSVVWSLFTFAKIGGAANYWMEPAVAAVVVFAHVPAPALTPRARLALMAALALQAIWTGVGSARASIEAVEASRDHAALASAARSLCGATRESLVVSDEPGVELMLDGRIVAHPFPLTHQIREGRLSPDGWMRDLSRPEIGCVVTMHDRIERPPAEVDEDYDYFAPPVRAALAARFVPVRASAGWEVYGPRVRAAPPPAGDER